MTDLEMSSPDPTPSRSTWHHGRIALAAGLAALALSVAIIYQLRTHEKAVLAWQSEAIALQDKIASLEQQVDASQAELRTIEAVRDQVLDAFGRAKAEAEVTQAEAVQERVRINAQLRAIELERQTMGQVMDAVYRDLDKARSDLREARGTDSTREVQEGPRGQLVTNRQLVWRER